MAEQTPPAEFYQDAIRAVEAQRNAAQNECVNLAATVQAERRQNTAALAERDAKIRELEAKIKEFVPKLVGSENTQAPPLTADGADAHVIN